MATVSAVAVTLDGRQAVSGSQDGTVRVWDLKTGRELARFRGEAGMGMEAIVLTPEGLGVVAGDSAGNVYCLRYVDLEAS